MSIPTSDLLWLVAALILGIGMILGFMLIGSIGDMEDVEE